MKQRLLTGFFTTIIFFVTPLTAFGATYPINTWVPTDVFVQASESSDNSNWRYMFLQFIWGSADNLSGFENDSNETLEMDLVMYNYDGNAWAYNTAGSTRGTMWDSNQPLAYLDTQFDDGTNERPFSVGAPDASLFQPSTFYYWWINALDTSSSTSMAKLQAQRGYRSPSNMYTTWNVFSEQTVNLIPFNQFTVPGSTTYSQ